MLYAILMTAFVFPESTIWENFAAENISWANLWSEYVYSLFPKKS